ncbi:hypothetical protein GCM10023100_16140 [Actinocorallia cavernae]|uniref:Uncharacterized protein n=2 Tax=Actinomycetes TaxID=1760 RepID=A0ABP5XYR0_9ACTN
MERQLGKGHRGAVVLVDVDRVGLTGLLLGHLDTPISKIRGCARARKGADRRDRDRRRREEREAGPGTVREALGPV